MSIVNNEQLKLTANWLNAMSIAFMVTGVIAPIIALSYDISSAPNLSLGWHIPIVACVCFLCAVVLHYLAKRKLRKLR